MNKIRRNGLIIGLIILILITTYFFIYVKPLYDVETNQLQMIQYNYTNLDTVDNHAQITYYKHIVCPITNQTGCDIEPIGFGEQHMYTKNLTSNYRQDIVTLYYCHTHGVEFGVDRTNAPLGGGNSID